MRALHWATFLAAIIVVVAILLYPSFAQQPGKPITTVPVKTIAPVPLLHMILPPVEYDHDYDGDLTIKMVDSIEELRALCKVDAPQMLACSMHNSRSCLIIMVKDEVTRTRGWTTGLLLRHEIGHCNGWGGDHAGERPLISNTHWVPERDRVRLPLERLEEADRIRAGAPR